RLTPLVTSTLAPVIRYAVRAPPAAALWHDGAGVHRDPSARVLRCLKLATRSLMRARAARRTPGVGRRGRPTERTLLQRWRRAGQLSRSDSVAASAAGGGRRRSRSILVSSVLRCTPKLLAASVWFQPCFSRVCRI